MLVSLLASVSSWPALVVMLVAVGLLTSLVSLGCGPAPPARWSNLHDAASDSDPADNPQADP